MYSEGEVDSEQRVSFAAKKQLFIQGFVFCFFCVPDIFNIPQLTFRGKEFIICLCIKRRNLNG